MKEMTFRPLKKDDFPQIRKIVEDAWDLGQYFKNEKSKAYLLNAFMHMGFIAPNYVEVVEHNGEVVGFLCGRINKCKKRISFRHLMASMVNAMRTNLTNDGKMMIRNFQRMQKVYTQLLKETKRKYDGELSFFAVHSKCKGLGIGKQLHLNFLQCCKNQEVQQIFLYTDELSNYGFYDHNDFTRCGELPITYKFYNGQKDFKVFIYEKVI